jgi:SAM-dependent methyltransferase
MKILQGGNMPKSSEKTMELDNKEQKNMQDGIEDIGSFGGGGRIRYYLRRVFYINPIVKEFKGHVLDIGCGVGVFLESYSGPSLGIDAHENNVKICQEKKINAIKADANSFIQENTFDTVLLSHVLEHLARPSHVLENAYLSTKRSGCIIIVLPCLKGFISGFNDLIGHKQFINEEYVDYYLLKKFNCEKLKSYKFPFVELGKYRELRIIYRKVR